MAPVIPDPEALSLRLAPVSRTPLRSRARAAMHKLEKNTYSAGLDATIKQRIYPAERAGQHSYPTHYDQHWLTGSGKSGCLWRRADTRTTV